MTSLNRATGAVRLGKHRAAGQEAKESTDLNMQQITYFNKPLRHVVSCFLIDHVSTKAPTLNQHEQEPNSEGSRIVRLLAQ